MRPLRIRLKQGIDPNRAVQVLNELIVTGGNVTSHGVGVGAQGMLGLRDAYLLWAEQLELQLRGLTLDPEIVAAIHTPRFWRIRELHEDPRPLYLLDAEVRLQTDWLKRLLDDQ